MRLVGAEIHRLWARRAFRILLLLLVAALALTLGITAYRSHHLTAADRARAAADASRSQADCRQAQQAGKLPADLDCQRVSFGETRDPAFHFAAEAPGRVAAFGVALALLGFLVGATFAGAEWSAGTMALLLTWEPRRLRVLSAKAAALVLALAGVGVLVTAAVLGGHYEIAALRGNLSGASHGLLLSTGLGALRVVALGCAAALAGFAIALTLRSTAATLGVALAYFVGGEILLRILWSGAPRWLLTSNGAAWVVKRIDLVLPNPRCRPTPVRPCTDRIVHLTYGHGAAYLGGLLLAVVVVAAVAFRRRDVT